MDPNVYPVAAGLLSLHRRATADKMRHPEGGPGWAMLDGYCRGLESGLAGIATIAGYANREELATAVKDESDALEREQREYEAKLEELARQRPVSLS